MAGLVKAGGWLLHTSHGTTSAPAADPHGPAITVAIPTGDDASSIAQALQDRGIIDDAGRFSEYANAHGEGSDFKAGTYEMEAGIDWDIVFQHLDAGPSTGAAHKLGFGQK